MTEVITVAIVGVTLGAMFSAIVGLIAQLSHWRARALRAEIAVINAHEALLTAPEINILNYTKDQVAELNEAAISAYIALDPIVATMRKADEK